MTHCYITTMSFVTVLEILQHCMHFHYALLGEKTMVFICRRILCCLMVLIIIHIWHWNIIWSRAWRSFESAISFNQSGEPTLKEFETCNDFFRNRTTKRIFPAGLITQDMISSFGVVCISGNVVQRFIFRVKYYEIDVRVTTSVSK